MKSVERIQAQDEAGKKIACILGMPKSRTTEGRFITAWGEKTSIGVYQTIISLYNDVILPIESAK